MEIRQWFVVSYDAVQARALRRAGMIAPVVAQLRSVQLELAQQHRETIKRHHAVGGGGESGTRGRCDAVPG